MVSRAMGGVLVGVCAVAVASCRCGTAEPTDEPEPQPEPATEAVLPEPQEPVEAEEAVELWVDRVADDEQAGSLRQRLIEAAGGGGPATIRFDATDGPFAEPQTISLTRPLPPVPDGVTIDGRIEGQLWKATGVTVDGGGEHRVFHVPKGSRVTLEGLTVARGTAPRGGGILNEGTLVVEGTTLVGNEASEAGGAIANDGGDLWVINSTVANNTASTLGGGIASRGGTTTIRNATFSGNRSARGTALASDTAVTLANTIMDGGQGELDCLVTPGVGASSVANVIPTHEGCGDPFTFDPKLGSLGLYNGPTATIPLGGGSPAINLGVNSAAVDENGEPLRWDQRGNGDPRFVAGFTDIGAFERQAFPDLVIDTLDDVDLRACTSIVGDCSLRGALVLAGATPEPDTVTFHPRVFDGGEALVLAAPLPAEAAPVVLDASGVGGVVVRGSLDAANLELVAVEVEPGE